MEGSEGGIESGSKGENLIAADRLQSFTPEYYKERKITEIVEKDRNVCIIGRVIDICDSALVIDDGSGKITAFIDGVRNPNKIKSLKINDIVRILGNVTKREEELVINAHIVQNFNGFDENLYRKILEIKKRVEAHV